MLPVGIESNVLANSQLLAAWAMHASNFAHFFEERLSSDFNSVKMPYISRHSRASFKMMIMLVKPI